MSDSTLTKYWYMERLSVKFQVILIALLLGWEELNSDPTHAVSMMGGAMFVGRSASTVTPLEELRLERPALLYPTTVVYTRLPDGRGVAKMWRKEVWSAGRIVGGTRSDPFGEEPA